MVMIILPNIIEKIYLSQRCQRSERSVRRFCKGNETTKLTNEDLDQLVADHIDLYDRHYGRMSLQQSYL